MKLDDILKRELDSIDHDHLGSSSENPLRDDAFDKYHNHKPFLNLIEKKFGKVAADNIVEMTKIKLKRKIKGDLNSSV